MSAPIEIDALDLAALISSRLCHDVISPVGAIVNGLEVLEEEDDPQMREFALDLVKKSARQASARLQFARLAFGAAGSAGAAIDLGDAEQVARGAIHDNKTELRWNLPRAFLPKNQVKLLLNLLVIAVTTIPRGGVIAVDGVVEGEQGSFRITSTGTSARIPANVPDLLRGVPPEGRVDAHVIQPFYTGLIARAAGMTVAAAMEGEASVILAAPAAVVGGAGESSTESVAGESLPEDSEAPGSL
jgi:histidine phosphotransferase ChpT